ncbi:hypothetical protein PFISCL1PPCAC_20798, partial [Pristionchus fissidentatus]
KRKCFILSSDQENIICAHGPFLESLNVPAWEQKESNPLDTPVRVKVYPNVCIDTVIPLGTTDHVIAISEIHQEKLGEDYKVYANLVHAADLAGGGYGLTRCRIVILTQPSTEQPVQ